MSADGYYTVFDVTQAGFKSWEFSAFGLIFIVVGVAMPTLIKKGIFRTQRPWMEKWFPRFFLGFAILWTLGSFITTFAEYRSAIGVMRSNRAEVVEGAVTQFKPMPYSGHVNESFVVNGVKFEYSDYGITAGFNNTTSHGGPIREGLPVKIWHLHGEILRLDVKKEPNQTPTASPRSAFDVDFNGVIQFARRINWVQYWSIGFALVILGRTIHYFVITRYLKRRGIEVQYARFSVRDWRDWTAYKKARLAEGQPIMWLYVLWTLQIILMFWLAGWLAVPYLL
jgi:hypothetical protein